MCPNFFSKNTPPYWGWGHVGVVGVTVGSPTIGKPGRLHTKRSLSGCVVYQLRHEWNLIQIGFVVRGGGGEGGLV